MKPSGSFVIKPPPSHAFSPFSCFRLTSKLYRFGVAFCAIIVSSITKIIPRHPEINFFHRRRTKSAMTPQKANRPKGYWYELPSERSIMDSRRANLEQVSHREGRIPAVQECSHSRRGSDLPRASMGASETSSISSSPCSAKKMTANPSTGENI